MCQCARAFSTDSSGPMRRDVTSKSDCRDVGKGEGGVDQTGFFVDELRGGADKRDDVNDLNLHRRR
jgi:hypothetical protein